jgi:hypothetical protein
MRGAAIALLLVCGCIKPEPKATREECESVTAKMALIGMRMDKASEAEIAEVIPTLEKAIAEVHAGRKPEGFPDDFAADIAEIETDCQKDFTSKDIACIRKSDTVAQVIACMW